MAERQYISLLKLQSIIRSRLEEAMPLPCWITAEIGELKVNYSGHCYLELVEKGGKNRVPAARASAVVWRSSYGAISSYFKSSTGYELSEGMNVLLKVSVSYHELYGLSLVVSDIDPFYTVGDMERQRQETILRLQEEGVFDMNRSLEMPSVIQRIAVISSCNAAGYQDFMDELGGSGFRFDTTLFDSFMQGNGAEDSIIEALEKIAEDAGRFDAVVIIRGGGSRSDLAAFDSYRLCCHLAQFPLPVITGIGHDKDESVADLVAAVTLKTPTAVAGWLTGGLAEFDAWLDHARTRLLQEAATVFDNERRNVRMAGYALAETARGMARQIEVRLAKSAGELRRLTLGEIAQEKNWLDRISSDYRKTLGIRIAGERFRLETASQLTEGRRPEKILSLGFAIVSSGGRAVKDAARLERGSVIDIRLARGNVSAIVENLKNTENNE